MLVYFDGGSAFEDGMPLDDYGYDSRSDREDEEEEKTTQTPISDNTAVLKGNISESDDDDGGLLAAADARSAIDSALCDPILASPPQAPIPITSALIQHKLPVVHCQTILVQVRDMAFRMWKALTEVHVSFSVQGST